MSRAPDVAGEDRAGPVVGVGAIVRDRRDRLLVVRRGRPPGAGLWSLPGGRVHRGEALDAAVVREVCEETGLTVEVERVVGVHEVISPRRHHVIVDHAARVLGGELEVGDDAAEVAWMRRSDLLAVETTDGLLDFLDRHDVAIAE